MARANVQVLEALRKTADHLEKSTEYQWGHMGSCNCGFLAQEVTKLDKKTIHQRAMMRFGDWNEQLNDYCENSGYPLDDIISELTQYGFSLEDLQQLERLSDQEVLRELPTDKRYLQRNRKEDVILYLRTWAALIEKEIVDSVNIETVLEPEIVERAATSAHIQ